MAKPKKDLNTSGLNELREDIKNKKFRRVYLLYGSEDYLVGQYRKQLIEAVCGDNATMNLNIHRDESLDWGQLQDEILSMPFFAEYRMVVLDDTKLFMAKKKSSSKEENTEDGQTDGSGQDAAPDNEVDGARADGGELAAMLSSFIPKIPETCVVVFTEQPDEVKPGGQKGKSSVDKRSAMYKAVAKCGLAVEFSPPDEEMLKKWVFSRLKAEKIQITSGAVETFMRMVGNNMSHISTETEKLISYAGHGGSIHTEDVRALTSEILEGKIFRMLDLISQHDRKGALELYDDLLQLKESPTKILILMLRQIDKLLLVRSILDNGGSIARVMEALGQSRWQADNVIRQARGFSVQALRETVEEGTKMQEKAQSGQIDMRLGLEILILKITGNKTEPARYQ